MVQLGEGIVCIQVAIMTTRTSLLAQLRDEIMAVGTGPGLEKKIRELVGTCLSHYI